MSDEKLIARERIDKSSIVLAHPARIGILELLKKEGSTYISEISKELELDRRSLVSHLRVLENEGMILALQDMIKAGRVLDRNPSADGYFRVKNYILTEHALEILDQLNIKK